MKKLISILLSVITSVGCISVAHGAVKAVVPQGQFAIFVKADQSPKLYVWDGNGELNGGWSGTEMDKTCSDESGQKYYYWVVPVGHSPVNCIINYNGDNDKTDDLKEIKANVYFEYKGSASKGQKLTQQSVPSGIEITTDTTYVPDPEEDPEPEPTPDPTPSGPSNTSTTNLITDYYKVNHMGYGSNRTVNMTFTNQNANNALSNWTESDMIAQGVGRDVCMAYKGKHERPIVDSYAIYAAYDDNNLYLGVQLVYLVWDQYGEGKQPGESKPYNMDGRLVWAFDLDPNKSFDGYIDGTKPIWNDDGTPGAKYQNGVDAVWIGSTKPGVGTPGFFIATPDGHASYDSKYLKSISGSYYGYADGLLPSITSLYGQKQFEGNPKDLEGNTGFVDLMGEISKSAHTFYEWKFPLSTLGISKNYIETQGIGVMFIDMYGSSPVGGTPYDPAYFDNVKKSYSKDSSTSMEKEDEDLITYAPARIGKATTRVESISNEENGNLISVVSRKGGVEISNANAENVSIFSIDGRQLFNSIVTGNISIDLKPGIYVVNINGKGKKILVY